MLELTRRQLAAHRAPERNRGRRMHRLRRRRMGKRFPPYNPDDDHQLRDPLSLGSVLGGRTRGGPTHLDMAHREEHEVGDVRVERKRKDEEDTKRRVERGRFNHHARCDLVWADVFPPEDIPHPFSEYEETAGDEERIDNGQTNLEAEIGQLGVDVVKDGTGRFSEDKDGHGWHRISVTNNKMTQTMDTHRPWLRKVLTWV